MDVPVEVSFREMDASDAVRAAIDERVEKLSRLHDRITSVRVTIALSHRHKNHGRVFDVHVDLKIPGAELVTGKSHASDPAHEDVYVALRDSFDALERQLAEHVRKHSTGRGEPSVRRPGA